MQIVLVRMCERTGCKRAVSPLMRTKSLLMTFRWSTRRSACTNMRRRIHDELC